MRSMRLPLLHPIEQQAPSLSRCVGKGEWRETLVSVCYNQYDACTEIAALFMKDIRPTDHGSRFAVLLEMKGARDLHHLPTFLRFLRSLPSLPRSLRLGIFLLSFIMCGAFMILGLLVTNNRGLTPIFAIPVALA